MIRRRQSSSTRSSSPSVWAACWSPSWPWTCTSRWCRTGSCQAKAAGSSLWGGENKSCLYHRWIWPNKDLLRHWSTAATPAKPSYSHALFLVAPERLRAIRWAPNYGGEDKLVKTRLRNDTSCSSSGDYEDEAVEMLHHNKWAGFFPSGAFTRWHKTDYCPQRDPWAQRANLRWKQNKDLIVSVPRLLKSFIFLEFAPSEMLDTSRLMQAGRAPTQTYRSTYRHSDGSVSTRPISRLLLQLMCRVCVWALQFVTNGEDITPHTHETSRKNDTSSVLNTFPPHYSCHTEPFI